MRERRAQIVLLVRAFEESDTEGVILPDHMRAAATSRAIRVTGLANWQGDLSSARHIRSGETVMRRARLLFSTLKSKALSPDYLLRVARLGAGTAPAIVLLALGLGLMTNLLGPRREINLLAVPVLGLLAWNLALYLILAGAALVRLVRRRPPEAGAFRRVFRGGPAARLAELFLKGALWRRLRHWKSARVREDDEARVSTKAYLRFGALWHRLAGALLASRVRRMLHLAGIALIIGAVGGMYLRGVAFEYHATWESTLLDARQVQALLDTVLGPAAAVLGVDVPSVAEIKVEGPGNAAVWIHLYAVTALLFVVLPRALLVVLESVRSLRLARNVPVDLGDGYFRRLFADWRGASKQIEIVPYSFQPTPAALTAARRVLTDFFGTRTTVRVRDPLTYGDDAVQVLEGSGERDVEPGENERKFCFTVLFNLAQTPEAEVHGRLLEQLKLQVDTRRSQLLVMVDVSDYRERVGASERWSERADIWRRVAREVGLTLVELDPDVPPGDDTMSTVGAALWPHQYAVGGD